MLPKVVLALSLILCVFLWSGPFAYAGGWGGGGGGVGHGGGQNTLEYNLFEEDVVGVLELQEPSYEVLFDLKTLRYQKILQVDSSSPLDKQLEKSRLEKLRSEAEVKGDAKLLGYINDAIYWNEQAELWKTTGDVLAITYVSLHLIGAYATLSTYLTSGGGLTVLGHTFSPGQTAWIEQGLSTIGMELIERLISD